jgi:DNA (cytosine-5)-methyltransferase 1
VKKKWRIAELYAGIGRTWEALREWSKCELCLLADVNESAQKTYLANHPNAPYHRMDLARTYPLEIQSLAGGPIDVLLGCPPCQGFSDTGKRDAADSMNAHIAVFGRYVEALEPWIVVLENVPLLAASRRFQNFELKLERLGYEWAAAILNAALYGSCQSRQRLILVAARAPFARPKLPLPTHGQPGVYYSYASGRLAKISEDPATLLGRAPGTGRVKSDVSYLDSPFGRRATPNLWQTIGDLQDITDEEGYRLSHTAWRHTPKMIRRMSRVPEGKRWSGGADHFSQSYGRLHRKGLARTITCSFSNPGSGRFWHPTEERSLTLREAARIQGIDDSFLFPGLPSHSAILVGNALDAALAKAAAQAVIETLES